MRDYQASSLGSCIKAQVARQLGHSAMDPQPWLQAAFDRGAEQELTCLDAMTAAGWTIHHNLPGTVLDDKYGIAQMFMEWSALPETKFRIRLDGAVTTDRDRVLEIKSAALWVDFERAVRLGNWVDNPRTDRPAWQCSVYMAATGRECTVACLDGETVRTFTIEIPPYSLDAIRSRVEEIELWVARGELPTTCSSADGDGCPFRYLHAPTEERVVLDDPTLADYLHVYTDLSATVAAGEKAKKARDQLARPEIPVGRYVCDGVDLTVHTVAGRKSLDEAAMVADHIDVEKYRRQGDERVQWKVS